jgi:S2P endopeptidase
MPSIVEHDHSKMRFNASSTIFIHFILQLLVIWCVIYLINHLLLRFRATKRSYIGLLRSLGCQVSIFSIGFYTTSFNRVFYRIGTSNSRLWKIWFTIGILVAFGTALTACFTLLILPIKYIYELQHRVPPNTNFINGDVRSLIESSSNQKDVLENDRDKLLIQPIIPGVNVPLEQMPHFFFALLLCTIFHEFGHAIAASAEQIRVNGCGYFLFLLYPGAYVDLHQEQLQMISAVRQLRIYCAGVFHNMVLVVIALIFLLLNPIFIRYFYTEAATLSNRIHQFEIFYRFIQSFNPSMHVL